MNSYDPNGNEIQSVDEIVIRETGTLSVKINAGGFHFQFTSKLHRWC